MHVISLKYIKANDILKRIEDKIKNNEDFEEEDIAALQLIVYTDYDETPLEILKKTTKLIEKMDININEKEAMLYVLDIISTNMLNKKDRDELMEDSKMLNPRYEYQRNEGRLEGISQGRLEAKLEVAKELLDIFPADRVSKITKLPVSEIMKLL